MCGICGFANSSRPGAVDISTLKKMADVIYHRGPDDEGFYVNEKVGLGIRRLSIIDLNTGHQPISNEDKSVTIVFNGEIYNFQELRAALLNRGHKFTTKTDTEVIVHLYEDFGLEFVKHLRGMFGIALWDERLGRMILARDRLGIKPLYYSSDNGVLFFGSEIKSIIAAGQRHEIDLTAVDDYLTFLYTPAPKTIYKDIKSLLPGEMLVFKEGSLSISKYWDIADVYGLNLSKRNAVGDENQIKIELYEILKSAVKEELISDVPLGAFLSGGIDSSIIVILMQEIIGSRVKTFSIGFENSNYDELIYAREIAKRFGTDHNEFIVKPEMISLLPSLVDYLDEPFADSSIVPTYMVSKLTGEHVKVALSGDGGDESFAGYSWTKINYLLNKYRSIPFVMRSLMANSLKVMPIKNVIWNKFIRAVDCGQLDSENSFLSRIICFDNELKDQIYTEDFKQNLKGYSSCEQVLSCFKRVRNIPEDSKMLFVDSSIYLPDDNLKKVDRMSMANSIEVRVPFLDHRVVEYAAGIPFNLKIKGLTTKYILKKAFEDKLPKNVARQRKHGFSMPVHDWFRNELKEYSRDLLLSRDAQINRFFKADCIKTFMERQESSNDNYGNQIFSLVMLELWLKKHFGVK